MWSRWSISISPSLWPPWLVQDGHMFQADPISCYPWMVTDYFCKRSYDFHWNYSEKYINQDSLLSSFPPQKSLPDRTDTEESRAEQWKGTGAKWRWPYIPSTAWANVNWSSIPATREPWLCDASLAIVWQKTKLISNCWWDTLSHAALAIGHIYRHINFH